MGPYCKFCNNRCFVHFPLNIPERVLEVYQEHAKEKARVEIIATCKQGQAFEKERIGVCYDDIQTAILEDADEAHEASQPDPDQKRDRQLSEGTYEDR